MNLSQHVDALMTNTVHDPRHKIERPLVNKTEPMSNVLRFLKTVAGDLGVSDVFVNNTLDPSSVVFLCDSLLIETTAQGNYLNSLVDVERVGLDQSRDSYGSESFTLTLNGHKAGQSGNALFRWTSSVPGPSTIEKSPELVDNMKASFDEFKRLSEKLVMVIHQRR